jgi:DUF971 family protein
VAAPIDVTHVRARNELVIVWDDGKAASLPIPYLRGWCACAACQGHQKKVRYHPAPDTVQLEAMWEVGAYALGLRFSDGHDTGIYRWTWMRLLAPEHEPHGLKLGGYFFNESYFSEG